MLPRLSTLAQVNRLTPPAVLLIGDHTHSADEAVVTAVTAAAKLPAYFVHFAAADLLPEGVRSLETHRHLAPSVNGELFFYTPA